MRDPGGRNAKNVSEIRTLAEKDSLPILVLELDVTNDCLGPAGCGCRRYQSV
jgi:hypothetical protein